MMRVIQIIISIIILSFAVNALDCQKFALKTGAVEFMTNETVNIWLSDVSVRCRDNNKCFDQYTSAELILPETCVDDFYALKTISKRDSVLYDPWRIVCNQSGNFTFKVLMTGGTEDCEEELRVRINAPKTYAKPTASDTIVDNDVSSIRYAKIEPIVQEKNKKKTINRNEDGILLLLSIFAAILLIFIVLLSLAVFKKRSRPRASRREKINKLKESY